MMRVVKMMSILGTGEYDEEGDVDNKHSTRDAGQVPPPPKGSRGCRTAPPQPRGAAVPSPGVLLEVGQLAEGLLAVGAVVGLDAQVDAQVLGQVGGVGEGFGAVGALVGLGLCVRLGVDLHLRLGEERQGADLTPGGGGENPAGTGLGPGGHPAIAPAPQAGGCLPVGLPLFGGLPRGQDGIWYHQDRRSRGIFRFDLLPAAFGLGCPQQAVALDCLDGVEEGGAGDS